MALTKPVGVLVCLMKVVDVDVSESNASHSRPVAQRDGHKGNNVNNDFYLKLSLVPERRRSWTRFFLENPDLRQRDLNLGREVTSVDFQAI